MRNRIVLALGAAVLAVAPFAQASRLSRLFLPGPDVTTEYDGSALLAHRSYSWGRITMQVPAYQGDVKAAIDKDLARRGWQLMPSGGSATVFVAGDVRGEGDVNTFYRGVGGDWAYQKWSWQGLGTGWKPGHGEPTFNAMTTAENHLVVDIFDKGSHQLLFRGVMGEDLSSTEKENTETLKDSLKRMFKKFPPKGTK